MIIEYRPHSALSVFHNSAIDRLTPVVQGVVLHLMNYVASTIAALKEVVLWLIVSRLKVPPLTGKPLIG